MTRETKIGLVVAGSFLCLVCVVVASKWNTGDDPSKEPEEQTIKVAAVKPTQNAGGAETKKKDVEPPPPKKVEPQPPPLSIPPLTGDNVRPIEAPKGEWNPTPPGGIQLPKEFQIANPKDGALKPLELPPAVKPQEPGSGVMPPPKPLQVVEEKKSVALELPPFAKPEVAPIKPVQDKDQSPIVVIPPKKDVPPLPAPKDGLPSLPAPKDGLPSFPPAPADGLPSFPPLPAPKDGVPSFPPLPAPKEGATITPKEVPMIPPLGQPAPLSKDGLPKPPTISDPPSAPPLVDLTPKPIPKIPANDLPSIPVGGAPPLPAVRDVSTDPYVCVAGDASFTVLSQRFYGSDKYAEALQAYNREHAKWIKNGSALLTNPPTLVPGQQVERPPVSILERSYRAWIREGNASVVPTIPPAGKVTITPPVTLGTPPGVAAVSNPPGGGTMKTYRVQNPNGESVFDVAERTLGNRSLWPEIWRVNQTNPAVRPPAPIPFGTELKLP